MKNQKAILVLFLALLLIPTLATAECLITADISAQPSNSPLGAYEYTMNFIWNMDSVYGLSHVNLMVDAPGGTCSCADFSSNFAFDAIAGTSDGEDDCIVEYVAFLECDGDPSIPNADGILFKFEPVEGDCEPGNTGEGTITFYSDLAPVPVDEEIMSMSDKAALTYCFGTITGVFPGMSCDPVGSEKSSWSNVKGLYR
jgi:hypothetical protein